MKKLILAIILFPVLAFGAHPFLEKDYQAAWCERAGGLQEVVLSDLARADCLTTTHAIEFDFAPKWAESIGQALYYSIMTGKKPGVVLILETPRDAYLYRLQAVAEKYGITVWTMTPGDLK